MVEYQVGCSDISQSNDANVKVRKKITNPGGDRVRMRAVNSGSPVSSWRSDQARKSQARTVQQMK